MISSKINIKDYFSIKLDDKYKYPLNFKFNCKIKKKDKSNLSSNGIYFIIEKDTNYVIYIGINLSKDPNNKNFVDEERIIKHLQSLTMRGTRIGISSSKKDWFNKCDKINEELFTLKDKIPNKDTGTTSDQNRLSYANIYWNKFKKDENFEFILNEHFYAYYLKVDFFDNLMMDYFSNNNDRQNSKKLFKEKVVNFFEEPLSKEYKPYVYIVKNNSNYPYSGKWRSKIFNLDEVKKSISTLINNYNSD